MRFPMKCYINGVNCITFLRLFIKLFKFEIQKCGQILCAHKPCFLMPGHILSSPVDQSTVEDGNDVAFIEVLNCSPPT